MKRLLAFLLVVLLCLTLCACDNEISEKPVGDVTQDNAHSNVPDNVVSVDPRPEEDRPTTPDEPKDDEGEGESDESDRAFVVESCELYGSYLTMCSDESVEYPYIKVFDSYSEVTEYYDTNSESFLFGRKFTLACASFNDEFLKENDVMMLVLSEDSSYINHKADEIVVTKNGIQFIIECHIPQDAPKSDTQYHLIFTAPNGSFAGFEDLPFELNLFDVVDNGNGAAFDAERFRMIYPEFYPFVYRADAKGDAETVVDTIDSYSELISFYEQYKDTYNLEAQFKKHVGTLYDENSFFNEYVLMAIIVPSKNVGEEIGVDELFIYNGELYMSVENTAPAVVSDKTECYVLATAIARSDLDGVNLEWFNISFN